LDDRKALRGLEKRNADALAAIMDTYTPYVATIVYNIIGQSMSQADVEEVCSDVFFALWRNADKPKANKLRAYLGTIARNMAKNKLRECSLELPLEDDVLIIPDRDEGEIAEMEQRQAVYSAVLSMAHPEREIFLRHYYYLQKISQIADEMAINAATIKTHLSRGREKLREKLLGRKSK
jgi:RNA polymerase sigma-70 factor (ECF subfamily)